MISNTRLRSNRTFQGQNNNVVNDEIKNEVSAFQRVHVIIDDQQPYDSDNRPNYINQNDIGIVSSPNIGADIQDPFYKPKALLGKHKKKKIKKPKIPDTFNNIIKLDLKEQHVVTFMDQRGQQYET